MQFTTVAVLSSLLATGMAAPQLEARQAYGGAQIPMTYQCSNRNIYGFIGCYVDDAQRHISDQKSIRYPIKNFGECIEMCRAAGAKFCSLQNGK